MQRKEFHISHDASRLISVFSLRWKERSRVSREIFNELNFKIQLIQGTFQWALLIFGIWLIMWNVCMVISLIIALVYDPVKPCCFNSVLGLPKILAIVEGSEQIFPRIRSLGAPVNSQVNIYLDVFQLSKTVFILARFCPKSADKECLILVPRSDLFRPRDFYGFDRFEISHFLPFLR